MRKKQPQNSNPLSSSFEKSSTAKKTMLGDTACYTDVILVIRTSVKGAGTGPWGARILGIIILPVI